MSDHPVMRRAAMALPRLRRFWLTLACGAALLPAAMAQAAEGPPVLASTPPAHALVEAVTSGIAASDLLLPAERGLQDVALTEAERERIAQYRVFVWIDGDLAATPGDLEPLAPNLLRLERGPDTAEQGLAWLDPDNARRWVNEIAETLSTADPINEAAYTSNARGMRARIDALKSEVRLLLLPVRNETLSVPTEALRPLAQRFDLQMEVVDDTDATQVCDVALHLPTPVNAAAVADDDTSSDTAMAAGDAIVNRYIRLIRSIARDIVACGTP